MVNNNFAITINIIHGFLLPILMYLDGNVLNSFNETDIKAHSGYPEEIGKLLHKHQNENVCLYAYGTEILTTDCEQSYPCGVCRIEKKKMYYLKGLRTTMTGDGGIFDSQFYFDGYTNGKPMFRYAI